MAELSPAATAWNAEFYSTAKRKGVSMNGQFIRSVCLLSLLVLLVTSSAASGASKKMDYVNHIRKVVSGNDNPSSNIVMWLHPRKSEDDIDVRMLSSTVSDELLARLLQQQLLDIPSPGQLARWPGRDGMIIEISSTKKFKLRFPNRHDQLLIANYDLLKDHNYRKTTRGPSFFLDSWH